MASSQAHVNVDEALDSDTRAMVLESTDKVKEAHPEGSFQSIFWEQEEAAFVKDSRSMRWHPLFIKWCLHLRHLSSKAYDMLHNSECLHLPSQW